MNDSTQPLHKRIYVCVTDNPVIVRGYANAIALTEGVKGFCKRCATEDEARRYFMQATGQPPPPILPPAPEPDASVSGCTVTVETADGVLRKHPSAAQVAALRDVGLWP